MVYVDNRSAIAIATRVTSYGRTKHLDFKYQFVKEAIHQGQIELKYIRSEDNVADVFTKPLGPQKFQKCVQAMGLRFSKSVEGVLELDNNEVKQ